MPDHVAVGKIQNNHVELAAVELLQNLVGNEISAHFGLQVVSCHFGRGDKVAYLVFVGLLDAAVKEERDVRILFGFRNSQLFFAELCKILAEGVRHRRFGERYVQTLELRVVDGKADVYGVDKARFSLERRALGNNEFLLGNSAGNLPCTVGAEVEAYYAVALFNQADGLSVFKYVGGLDELVGHALIITRLDGLQRVVALVAVAEGEHVVRLLGSVPVVVSVHCEVSSANGRDFADAYFFHFGLKFGQIPDARSGGGVSAVHKAVDEHVFKPEVFRHFQKRVNVRYVAVNAAVG